MRILLIVDDYLPHSIKVAAKMMHDLALEFKAANHDVWVLTPAPSQKENVIFKEIDEINVIYFRSGEIKNTSKILRTINETMLSWRAWNACESFFHTKHFNGIVYYSPSIFWGPLIGKLRSLWRCKSYLIQRDIFPQWTLDNGLMSKKSPVYWYFKMMEWMSYRNASTIGVMSVDVNKVVA